MSEVNDEVELPAPRGETNAEAFKRLAKARVNAAIKRIQLIGNLSNRVAYEYTPDQVARMRGALESEIEAAFKRFEPKSADKPAFDFDD